VALQTGGAVCVRMDRMSNVKRVNRVSFGSGARRVFIHTILNSIFMDPCIVV
jgi:hypothetical protein